MNPNRIVSLLIIIAIYCGPFGMLFIYNDVLVDTFAEMGLFLISVFGLILAFYFSVNQPIGRAKAAQAAKQAEANVRKAA
jgi:hypothetical protein